MRQVRQVRQPRLMRQVRQVNIISETFWLPVELETAVAAAAVEAPVECRCSDSAPAAEDQTPLDVL